MATLKELVTSGLAMIGTLVCKTLSVDGAPINGDGIVEITDGNYSKYWNANDYSVTVPAGTSLIVCNCTTQTIYINSIKMPDVRDSQRIRLLNNPNNASPYKGIYLKKPTAGGAYTEGSLYYLHYSTDFTTREASDSGYLTTGRVMELVYYFGDKVDNSNRTGRWYTTFQT